MDLDQTIMTQEKYIFLKTTNAAPGPRPGPDSFFPTAQLVLPYDF